MSQSIPEIFLNSTWKQYRNLVATFRWNGAPPFPGRSAKRDMSLLFMPKMRLLMKLARELHRFGVR
jgi:hypothetical protein